MQQKLIADLDNNWDQLERVLVDLHELPVNKVGELIMELRSLGVDPAAIVVFASDYEVSLDYPLVTGRVISNGVELFLDEQWFTYSFLRINGNPVELFSYEDPDDPGLGILSEAQEWDRLRSLSTAPQPIFIGDDGEYVRPQGIMSHP